MTTKDLLEVIGLKELLPESNAFLDDRRKYVKQTVGKLKTGMPVVDDLLSDVDRTYGPDFLFGIHWAFTLLDNLHANLGERNWLERTLLKRNRQFYQSQAGLVTTQSEKFSQSAGDLVDRNFTLKSQILFAASSMNSFNEVRAFRTGVLFGIEILLRIEDERSSMAVAAELQQSFQ